LSVARPSAITRTAQGSIHSTGQALKAGLLTSLSNPKSGAFWTGVFATTFPAAAPLWFHLTTAFLIASLSLGWHVGLALVFTSGHVQAGYQRVRRLINAACGGVLVALGLRLALER
ncbi:MAG TPA: LysE family transporter, partial [Nordella sp.]|nr:LysE family transporter [Nordella sp.]